MDPLSNMLSQIKNALAVGKPVISVPFSNFKYNIASFLADKGYLKNVSKAGRGVKKYLKIELLYKEDGAPAIENLKKISKPGQRIYVPGDKVKISKSGFGMTIVSTSKGLMSDKEARKNKLGGELICEIL